VQDYPCTQLEVKFIITERRYNSMTPRELRQLLFQIDNQNMTVKELREKLFRFENQDKELTSDDITEINISE